MNEPIKDSVRISERRVLEVGDICSLRGKRGKFAYKYYRISASDRVELTFYGGTSKGVAQYVTVDKADVKAKHRAGRFE